MSPLRCELLVHARCEALHHIYTGFAALHRRGLVGLKQTFTDPVPVGDEQHLRSSAFCHVRVVVNGELIVHYDFHDSHEIHPKNVQDCHIYFKRSFSRRYVETVPHWRGKVLPAGLTYNVLPDFVDRFGVERVFRARLANMSRLKALQEAVDVRNLGRFAGRVRHLEVLPDLELEPSVLFLVTAYDPYDRADRPPEKVEQFRAINEMRAACLRRLRGELGPRFFGGFVRNAFTEHKYPDLLAENGVTKRGPYLERMRGAPICVASTGLHGSVGWKFAEYVAASRAIVSERLVYDVPGVHEGQNYLPFETPDDCVEACVRLMDDPDLRARLMIANAQHYRMYLQPDVFAARTLLQALSSAAGAGQVALKSASHQGERQSSVLEGSVPKTALPRAARSAASASSNSAA